LNVASILFWTSLSLIFYTYVLYPCILALIRIRFHELSEQSNSYHPSVTIVFAAYNEESVIEEKLMNIKRIDYPKGKIEVIVGSDGSVDRTNEMLTRHRPENLSVRVFDHRRGKAAVLNALLSEVKSEIVVFSDANTLYQPDTVGKLVQHFVDPSVGAVCGQLVLESVDGSSGGLAEASYWNYENMIKRMESDIQTTVGATGAVYAIRKNLYRPLPVGKLIMDDFLIALSIVQQGYRVKYEANALAREKASNSVAGEFRRKVRIGAANFHGISEFAQLLSPRFGFVSFALWSHKIIRWFVPILLLVVIIAAAMLAPGSSFYQLIFLSELAFIGFALIGLIAEKVNLNIGFFGLPYYFLAVNAALLVGFVKFVRGHQRPTWEVVR